MAEIRVPTLGELVTEATIGKWFKKAGDAVAVDEPLVELETDKVTIEVPAPAAGVLTDVAVKDGDTVAVGALLGADQGRRRRCAGKTCRESRRRGAASRIASEARLHSKLRQRTRRWRRQCARLRPRLGWMHRRCRGPARMAASARATCSRPSSAPQRSPTPVATPAAAVQVRAPSPADDAAREERVRMTRLRQTIARRLKDAQNTAAMLTTFNEVDMSARHGAA